MCAVHCFVLSFRKTGYLEKMQVIAIIEFQLNECQSLNGAIDLSFPKKIFKIFSRQRGETQVQVQLLMLYT